MEIWKKSHYHLEVSNYGNVRSTIRGPKKQSNSLGYKVVAIKLSGKSKVYKVHRLVAQAFLGDGSDLVVNHIDGDKANNHVSNLEWCTQAENLKHAREVLGVSTARDTAGEKNGRSKLTANTVREIRSRHKEGSVTQASLAREYGVGTTVLCDIINMRSWANV
jgi:hypothetical protein